MTYPFQKETKTQMKDWGHAKHNAAGKISEAKQAN